MYHEMYRKVFTLAAARILCRLNRDFVQSGSVGTVSLGRAALTVAMVVYAIVLTVAKVHSLDIARYRTTYSPLYLLMLSLMATFLLAISSLVAGSLLRRSGWSSDEHSFQRYKSIRL